MALPPAIRPGQLPDYSRGPATPVSDTPADWLSEFLASGLASMGELVGIRPTLQTQEWRQQNPVAGFLSGLAGFAVPYTGWLKATTAIPRFNRAIQAIGNLERAPITTGAMRAAARFVPFEAGRVAVSQVVGEEDLGSMLSDAILSLAIEGGVGGLLGGIAAAGTRGQSIARLAPGIDLAAPTQLQTRYIQELLTSGKLEGDAASRAAYRLREMRTLVRSESAPTGRAHVSLLEGSSKTQTENISRLFNLEKTGTVRVQLLAQSPKRGFSTNKGWQEVIEQSNLPENWEDYVQYPRAVSFRGGNSAEVVGNNITRNLSRVGDNWYLGREADDGMFVLAHRFARADDTFSNGDRWLIFKTDTPSKFLGAQQNWANAMVARSAWVPESKIAADGGPVYNAAANLMKQVGLNNYLGMAKVTGGVAAAIDKLVPLNKLRGESLEMVSRLKDVVKEYMAPARIQFKSNPLANWMHNIARSAYDMAQTEAQRILYGDLALESGKNQFVSVLSRSAPRADTASVKGVLDPLTDDDVTAIWDAWRRELKDSDIEQLVKDGLMRPEARDAISALRTIDDEVWGNINTTQRATGNSVSKQRYGHMMLSRQWEGDYRIILRGEDGSIVGQASGFNRRGAQKEAERLQKALEEEGTLTHIAESIDMADASNVPRELRPTSLMPGFVLERGNVRGFRWDLTPFTKQELQESLANAVYSRYRYMANMSVNDLLATELSRLAKSDPQSYKMLADRMNDLAGVQTNWGQMQNRAVDKIMGPMLGKNSATKIVAAANTAMWHLTLGAMKMSYPIVNAMQFLQTVAPEIAFVMSAPASKIAGTYTYFAAGGKRGLPQGIVGALNPFKVTARSFAEMRAPGKELSNHLLQASKQRVIDPRFAEEFVGEQSATVSDLKGAISSPAGFVGWLRALSEWAPAISERFARTQAFTTGHILGRDYLNLTGEHLYRFAKEFTENTSYLYSVADRPRMFTTPAGSAFGLFKNWVTNYTATMLTYSGEALRGNWAPLLWQTAGTAAVGGLAATPLSLIANGFANAFTGKSMLELTYEMYGEEGGAAINFGLPAVLGNISLYSQAATPLSNPARDASMLFSIAHYDRMQHLGRAVGEAYDHWAVTRENPARNPNVRDHLIRALAPTTLYKLMGAIQETGIVSTGSGLPLVMEASPVQKFLYTIGFTPVEMEAGLAVAEELFSDRDARQRQIQQLGEAYADAFQNRDGEQMRMLLRQAIIRGVDASSVLRSAQARVSQREQDILGRNFQAEDLLRFQQALNWR